MSDPLRQHDPRRDRLVEPERLGADGFPHPADTRSTEFRCSHCDYDLSGTAVGGACPECGTPVAESLRQRTVQAVTTNQNAVASLVVGILSLGCCALLGPIAIVLYSKAMNEIRTGAYTDSSKGIALVGLVTGILGTIWFAAQVVMGLMGVYP